MSYQICYPDLKKKEPSARGTAGLALLTAAAFLSFLLLVGGLWQEGSQLLEKVFFSGERTVTVMALEELAQDLEAGEGLGSALENFCRSVIRESDACGH